MKKQDNQKPSYASKNYASSRALHARPSDIISTKDSNPKTNQLKPQYGVLRRETSPCNPSGQGITDQTVLPAIGHSKTCWRKKSEDLTLVEKQSLAETEGQFFLNRETGKLGPFTTKQLHEFTGVSMADIRAMERDGVIRSFKKDGKKFFKDDNIRLVMCWREIRLLGFSPEIGYDTYMLKLYKEHLRANDG